MELFTVRPMEESDLEVVMYLENTCFIAPWGLKELNYEINDNPVSNLWVIESSMYGVAGFVDYWITFDSATICQICINPVFRKKGLASQMMSELIKDCKANKVRNITLEVREHNEPAIRLYERFGFKKILLKEKYYTNGDNAIYMVKEMEGNN